MRLSWLLSMMTYMAIIAISHQPQHVQALQPKSINVGVKATWATTSVLAEASEFYASHSNDLYWQFINGVVAHIAEHGVPTQRAEYDLALAIAAKLSGNATLDVLRYSLAIRYYSPKVEMFAQLSRTHIAEITRDHPSDVDVNSCATLLAYDNTITCGIRDSQSFPTTPSFDEETFDFDHIHTNGGSVAATTVVLYADIASPLFAGVHTKLAALATKSAIRYVLRPRALVDGANAAAAVGPLSLQGFGVELALKNMEYKVLDDQKISVDLGGAPDLDLLDDGATGGDETDVNGFYINKLKSRRPDLATELDQFRADLLSRADDTKAINVWELKDLGFQAAQRIIKSSDALHLLRELSQNFPMYGPALTKTRTNTTLKNTMIAAGERHGIHAGMNSIHVNGVPLPIDEVDIYGLQAVLHREASTMDELKSLRLSSPDIRRLVSIPPTTSTDQQGSQSDAAQFRIDMDIDGTAKVAVTFMNDIPVDRRYVSWPPSVQELLAPGWPNQLRYVRKNLYTAVIVMDPTTREGLTMFSRARYFVNGNAPIRVGITFFIPQESTSGSGAKWNDELLPRDTFWKDLINEQSGNTVAKADEPTESTQAIVAKLFKYIHEQTTAEKAFDFLQALLDLNEELTNKESTIRQSFIKFWKKNGSSSKKDAKDIYSDVLANDDMRVFVTKTQAYVHSRGFKPDPFPCMVVNGIIHRGSNDVQFRELMMHAILSEQHGMMMRVYRREITDSTNIPAYFAAQPFTYPGGSEHVLQAGKDQQFVSSLPSLPRDDLPSLVYFSHSDREYNVKGATYIIAADLSTASGVDLVAAAITHVTTIHVGHDSRIAVIPNPSSTSAPNQLSRVVAAVTKLLKPKKAFTVLRRLIHAAQYFAGNADRQLRAYRRIIGDESLKLPSSVMEILASTAPASSDEWISGGQGVATDYITRAARITAGTPVVIANGRIITIPSHLTYHQMVADFKLMDLFEYRFQNAKKVLDIIEHTTYVGVATDDISSDYMTEVGQRVIYALSKRAAASAATPSNGGAAMPVPVFDANDAHVLKYHSPTSLTEVIVVLDPLSKAAQRITPMLIALRDGLDCSLSVYLNPVRELAEFPLKRFYRYAIQASLQFDDNGAVKPAVGAVFRHLHTDKVLTMGLSTPESWLVAATVAHYDLDNIRLTDMTDIDTMVVSYTLEKLLISGQCLDTTVREHPAGLQVVLGTATETTMHDTIVMQNLGYFQLQTRPGVWQLRVARGRHSEIYTFESSQATTIRKRPNAAKQIDVLHQMNTDSHAREPYITWPVMTFHDTFTRLPMKRKPGQEVAKLEQETTAGASGGLWNSIFGSKPEHSSNETIHIFSLASGHLYERFLKIMMLSVVKNTKSPVKFWFLKNFLSPQFKEFVPQMAAHYGFEVELMTYKWPSWLRQQEEKQRIIWGYKILFLDVLFPLKLRRVIYVDADQVVRGDVKELWDRDLGGAPYAYTPFCESNKDVDGFRFWNQGYWRDHLRGRPYHISALYIVDLDRFRASRAGDSLRMMYDNLSADKNSLANLDQDLPNYAQHMVPIHSLPMEWLWCQTWCSMDTLAQAKTIDLCNNPNTKTPKLEVAKQLLPEWPGLDNEARSLDPIFAARREADDKAKQQRGYEADALRARTTRDL